MDLDLGHFRHHLHPTWKTKAYIQLLIKTALFGSKSFLYASLYIEGVDHTNIVRNCFDMGKFPGCMNNSLIQLGPISWNRAKNKIVNRFCILIN